MKIVFNKKECIGCGACVVACPEFWFMGEDNKASLVDSVEEGGKMVREIKEEGCAKQAESVCPVQVIKIKE